VTVDPSTGLALFASEADGSWTLQLVQNGTVIDNLELTDTVLNLVGPDARGDMVVITESEGQVSHTVYDAWPDQAPDLPPLYAYLFTAIEAPSDAEIETLACEGTSSFDTNLTLIESNANVLKSLGVPVVLSVTYNFTYMVEKCGREEIFDLFEEYGFEVGSMVHNRPGYHCTDQAVSGTTPDQCAFSSPYYCNPSNANANCSFPDDEDYCALGDWDCYKSFIDEHNVVVDRNINGGGNFIIGADRHGIWEYDWARAYKEMARADGSEGYDVAFFAQTWAYNDVISIDDPRGKDPAPWRLADRSEAWALGDYTSWDQDSAFSDLLFLPGLPISVVKISEWQESGMYMLDYFNYITSIYYSEKDFDVVHQFLRSSMNLRSPYEPNVWYFHIHELSDVNLADATGKELEGAALLRNFIDDVNATYDEDWLVWGTPSEIREMFPPREQE